jgi:hypothetical protein
MTTNGIDFVNENDGGRFGLRLRKQIANARCANADEHLNKVGTANRKERHTGFASDGACEQGLAGSRRAGEQHAPRDTSTDGVEAGGRLQELANLNELVDGFINTGNVGERDDRAIGLPTLGLAATRRTTRAPQ